MRITILSPPLNMTGGLRVVSIYADRLSKRGHRVVVVAPPPRKLTLGEKLSSLRQGQGWPSSTAHQPSHFDGLDVACRMLDRYRPIVEADVPDADVVIATWWETAEWVAKLSPRKGAKAYFLQHYEVFPYLPIDRVEATWRLPFHKIAVAQWLVDLARERYVDGEVSLAPNAVDHDQFHAPPRRRNEIPTIGLMYSTAPFKGCDISLRAFQLCAERNPGLRLVAFGTEPPSPTLPLPPGTDYYLRPPQDALRDIYARCDCFLFGSRSEGFGLPILEAMACRTPVIGTPAGAAPELIAGGGGLLVAPEDPVAMARRLEELIGFDARRWNGMSEAAFATAACYNWEHATDRFESALQLAAARSKRRPFESD